MTSRIQEVIPDELADAVESGGVTLVLSAPGIGTSRHLQPLCQSVEQLPETTAVDDQEPVIVEDFVSAVFDLEDEPLSSYTYEYGEKSLFSRSGGAVLVTRPRSFDWLCRSDHGVSGSFIETVDTVLLVRTPPTGAAAAVDAVRQRLNKRSPPGLRDDERAAVLEQARYPPYYFDTPELQQHLGWYDATVTPAAFLSLSKYDTAEVLFPDDVGRAFGDRDVSVGPFSEAFADAVSRLVPSGGLPSQRPHERSPAVLAAVALVTVGLADDADWLEPLARYRVLPTTAEGLEIALDLPPGTVDHLRVFADDPARALIRDRLADDADEESVVDAARDVIGQAVDALHSAGPSFETMSMGPEEYGTSPLVGAWHWDGPQALHDAAAERELPTPIRELEGTDDETDPDWRSLVDGDELLEALDGGLVVLSGPKASGKRQLAASLASELADWGATVTLPVLTRPDHVRTGIEATPNAVVVATYGAEPAAINGDDGVRALPEWVDDGSCAGAVLICDDTNRARLEDVAERAGCDELAAWTDRVEFSVAESIADIDREPATVARDLLDAIGWNEIQSPSRRSIDVESVTDQSTLAAIAGVPDHALDGEFVGTVVAEAVDVISTTHGPAAAEQWLSFIDDLVADVGRNRTADSDESLLYRGEVYGTAIAAVARANPRTDEWVHAVARGVLEVTNETAAPHGRESVGGDVEPFATAFTGALARLAQPPDGSRVNHGAIECVDQALHEMVSDDGWQFPLHFVYGGAVGRIVRRADDPAAANGGITTIVSRVRQHAMSPNDRYTMGVLGSSFASMLGAVAGIECSPEELSAWVADIESRAREAVQIIIDREVQRMTLTEFYVAGIGLWLFEHGCPDEDVGSFFDAVGRSMCHTATAFDLDHDPETFVLDGYGHAVRTIVQLGELERAELLFSTCHRLVDTIAESGQFETEQQRRAALHANALASFGDVEQDDPDAVSSYPYGRDTIPFDDSLGFEDWMERYDAAVTRGVAVDASTAERTQYLTEIYRETLSTHVQGFDADSDDGVTPREEHTWYAGLTDRIEARATTTDSVDDPVQFLADVYGEAAVNWATDGDSSRAQEWITVLVQSLRTSRESIDGPDTVDWFEAFASTDAEILAAVLTRTDVGERTHERLVEAVLSQIQAAAAAPDNPPHPVTYVASVFGGALALAADAPAEEVRFGVTEVLAVLQEAFSLEWIELERADIFKRVYAEALSQVGRTHTDVSETAEWFELVSTRIEATATKETPEQPAEFVAAVYVRAIFDAAQHGGDEWRRRLDAELREFTRGPYVDDPAAFLEGLYADVVVEGAKRHGPRRRIEACIEAVSESLQAAGDAELLRADGALGRTVSRTADTLSSVNVKNPGDYVIRIDHGLRRTGYETLANDLFEVEGSDEPDFPDGEPVSNTDGGRGSNPPEREDR
ncbi:hypothetical protein [Natrinema salaciae]|uniref:Uncharacterized protein n=1 Tax=Natrinema salaciae TaxID=1186196 RepID=A0A1H9GM90_9EURY|nr:hypothetical protein [Natrinema salaciae]SEQ51227.1 hypothetical protein SAMN04489841_1932 [Natrinema salaciae]